VARLGVAVVGLAFVALVLAYVFFDWPVLLVGVPAFIAVDLVVIAVLASEKPRRKLEAHRASRFDPSAQVPGGLMSGFFELNPQPRKAPDHTA
jgi:hypothetical protein